MVRNLNDIFSPRSVALLGATAKEDKWAYRAANNILKSGYKGRVYFVNPKGGKILKKRVYPSIFDIREKIDLALMALPVEVLKDAVRDCAKKRVKGIILITAGLGEVDKVGLDLQNELVHIAHEGGSRIIGPNCMGIICNPCKLNLTSSYRANSGSIGFISQSGNLGIALLDKALKIGLGFSYFFSIGNQADITITESLEFLRYDKHTKTILIYMEGVPNVRKFLHEAQETSKIKPVIVYKAGATQAGSRSAISHTGALTGKDYLYDTAFKQTGLLRVTRIDEFLQVAETLNHCPALRGDNVILIGGGGGHATTMAEATERYGVKIPTLPERVQKKAKELLIWRAAVRNPIDFAGGGDGKFRVYDQLVDLCFREPTIYGAIVFGIFGGYLNYLESPGNSYEDSAYELAKLVKKYNKPIVVQTVFAEDKIESIETLRSLKIPVHESVEITAKAMSALREYSIYAEKLKNRNPNFWPVPIISSEREIFDSATANKRLILLEPEIGKILGKYSIPFPRCRIAKNKDDAVRAGKDIGYPVALKIISPDIIHKSDSGAVRIGLRNDKEVERAYDQIMSRINAHKGKPCIHGMGIFQSMPKGLEIIIGAINDDEFGPVIMFGLGGILVEYLKDVSFRVLPITQEDAYEMIKEIKGFPVLEGVRGRNRVDIRAIVDTLIKVSMMMINNPDIKELDINPCIVYRKGISAVDARILLHR